MTTEPFWIQVDEPTLRQGDYLLACLVPVFGPNIGPGSETHEVLVDEFDLIVVTQSCDLENRKVRLVAMSPIYPISRFEETNPSFRAKGRWNEVLRACVRRGGGG